MRLPFIFILASLIGMSVVSQGEAAFVAIGGPGITLSVHQPLQAVVVDASGNPYQQTVYYDPALGGVDLDASWAGPNASVYFPAIQTGFVWYNGFWVDHTGYYWNGGHRVYVGHPNWGVYWSGYWHNHWHSGWHGAWHGGWHGHPGATVHVHETIHEHWHHHH